VFYSVVANTQTIKELEQQKDNLNKRIENSSKLLASYSKQRVSGLNNINVLNQQISDRERLIELYNSEIRLLTADIDALQFEIADTEKELKGLKSQYSKLINETYKNKKRYNELSFFFGAESFNEAYRRYNMLKEYNRFRHNQGVLINEKSQQLDEAHQLLKTKLKVQNIALNKANSQYEKLVSDKSRLGKKVNALQQKESTLKKEIRKQKRALKKLEDTIVKLIAELAKEDNVEPSDFHLAKGKLPWPIINGVVVSKFGEHKHPVLKYVKVNNNGIDIQSTNDLEAKTVFTGKVSRIVPIPGYNKAVLIRHGRYLTVYANIDKVRVNPGENVTKNDVIGTIYSGNGENSGVLHFEIWEESVKINPELWLIK